MKPFHGIGGQSAVVGYVVLWTGCHAVQQCLETIGLGFAVEKLLALVCRAILVQLNILLELNWQVMRIFSIYLIMMTPFRCVAVLAVVGIKVHDGF